MLRVSFVVSVSVHVLIVSVVSVVVAQNARRTMSEIRTFQITVQHPVRSRVQASGSAPDIFPRPAVTALAARPRTSQPLSMPDFQNKRHAVAEIAEPKNLRMSAPVHQKQMTIEVPLRQMLPQPHETSGLAEAFPTPLSTPPRVQTARSVTAPTPTPTPFATSTPVPVKPVPTLSPTPMPTPVVARTLVADATPEALPAEAALISTTDSTPATPATPGNALSVTKQGSALAGERSAERPETRLQVEQPAIAQERLLKTYVRDLATHLQATQTYPRKARRNGWEGIVVVKLHLEPTGAIERVELAQSSGFDVLDQAALQAVQDAQPLPAFPVGVSAPALILNIPIRYQLK